MDAEFWISAWKEGRTQFHRQDFHDKLLKYFPRFKPQNGSSVLVPLCGKSKDLIWLQGMGLRVHGIELHEDAVKAFFEENDQANVQKSQDKNYINYKAKDILISCGDFFKLPNTNHYDFVYDRASLVALPAAMRKNYVEVIKRSLKSQGKCLLLTYEYDQSKMDGPPFCVLETEVRELYQDQFHIELLEREETNKQGTRFEILESLKQCVYVLEKR